MQESYEMCEAAKDAIVFYHSREDMFLIHVAWSSKLYLPLDGRWLIKYPSVCSIFQRRGIMRHYCEILYEGLSVHDGLLSDVCGSN